MTICIITFTNQAHSYMAGYVVCGMKVPKDIKLVTARCKMCECKLLIRCWLWCGNGAPVA